MLFSLALSSLFSPPHLPKLKKRRFSTATNCFVSARGQSRYLSRMQGFVNSLRANTRRIKLNRKYVLEVPVSSHRRLNLEESGEITSQAGRAERTSSWSSCRSTMHNRGKCRCVKRHGSNLLRHHDRVCCEKQAACQGCFLMGL